MCVFIFYQGPIGIIGLTGPVGETGPKGEQGIKGDKGHDGDKGQKVSTNDSKTLHMSLIGYIFVGRKRYRRQTRSSWTNG